MPRYKAAAACWCKPDDHAGARRIEPGETFLFSGVPNAAMIPQDVAARRAKRLTLPNVWPVSASPPDTLRVSAGLRAHPTSNLTERRRLIENFIRENPLEKVSA